MNKAEEFAWKLYPNTEPDPYAYPNELAGVRDYNLEMSLKRYAVIEGYTQGLKDLSEMVEKSIDASLGHAFTDKGTTAVDGLIEVREMIKKLLEDGK